MLRRPCYGEVFPNADIGQSEKWEPDDQLAGKAVRLVCALVSLEQVPPGRSRNFSVPLPVPSMAIQYLVPLTMLAEGATNVLNAPTVIALELICESNVPGCPALSL